MSVLSLREGSDLFMATELLSNWANIQILGLSTSASVFFPLSYTTKSKGAGEERNKRTISQKIVGKWQAQESMYDINNTMYDTGNREWTITNFIRQN